MNTIGQALSLRPIFSETFLLTKENPVFRKGVFIYRITSEERTKKFPDYLTSANNEALKIIDEDENSFKYESKGVTSTIDLTDESLIEKFLTHIIKDDLLYIDITGLSHSTWAVLIKVSFKVKIKVKIIYAEPITYNAPQPNTYELSIKINPIKPMPGFAVLRSIGTSNFTFIPLLGFERRRFELMLTNVDPPQHSVFPIVGVPGFQLNFPFETFLMNKKKLLENELYQNVHFAAASCPFRLYYTLWDLVNKTRTDLYKIALIGTKPHALGAILFYLCSGLTVELLYDHPKRKKDRSSGAYKLHVYHIDEFSDFLKEV